MMSHLPEVRVLLRRLSSLAAGSASVASWRAAKDAGSADTAQPSVMTFDTARIRLVSRTETTTVRVELAIDSAQRTMGLMERQSLAPDAGMLFLFDSTQAATRGFWMFRTRIPLDIAYIDSAGVIGSIVAMQPCAARLIQGCPSYPAGVPYRATLEVNPGFFRDHKLAVGDRVLIADTAGWVRKR